MENIGERALKKITEDNKQYFPNKDEQNFDTIPKKDEFTPENALEKQLIKDHKIDQQIQDILFMDDKRLENSETLRLNKIYYLGLKSKIGNLQSKIEDLRIKQAMVNDDELRDIYKKISLYSQKNEEYLKELEGAKKINQSYSENVLKLTQELEEYDQFLANYTNQLNNFYDN
tara:strand:- start:923 stop:1441 length:519 start_codon:yes stop_codon:yes gene_type:complete